MLDFNAAAERGCHILPFGGKKPLRAKIILRAAVFSANIKTL